jgi:putative endonuclease
MREEINKNKTGRLGEEAAANFLRRNGYEIIEMNFKNTMGRAIGEIDIVAKDLESQELVFVEVKTREYQKYKDTLPEENITPSKLRKLSKIASAYLNYKNLMDASYRFDAISVWLDQETTMVKIKHIKSI